MFKSFNWMRAFYEENANGFSELDQTTQDTVICHYTNLFAAHFNNVPFANGFIQPLFLDQWKRVLQNHAHVKKIADALQALHNTQQENEEAFASAVQHLFEIFQALHTAYPRSRTVNFNFAEVTHTIYAAEVSQIL